MLSVRSRLAVVSLIILAVFSPAVFGELITVDDLDTYNWVKNTPFTLKDLFFPAAQHGAYYRPLIGTSYLVDKYVWMLDTRWMHLENIVFHIFNALLIAYLVRQFLPKSERDQSLLPYVAALFFGLHPITSESVNWISGRTDVMACTFVLLSATFVMQYRGSRQGFWLVAAVLVLIPGLLFKETDFAFILGGAFIVLSRREEDDDVPADTRNAGVRAVAFTLLAIVLLVTTYRVEGVFAVAALYLFYELLLQRRTGTKFRTLPLLSSTVMGLLTVAAFLLVRRLLFTSSIVTIPNTITVMLGDINYTLQTFLGAAGFYVKKFFLPLPLNLAIREIDPFYNLVGTAVFFFCLFLIRRGTLLSAYFLAGVAMFLPALPLSLGTITWTAYAERYIYISAAFWSIAVVVTAWHIFCHSGHRRLFAVSTGLLIVCWAVVSLQRSITWRSNLDLLHDTISKSPGFKTLRSDYMVALMNAGDLKGAKAQYAAARAIPSIGYMESLDINMAAILVTEGKFQQAQQLYEKIIRLTKGKSTTAYSCYASFLNERLADALNRHDDSAIRGIGRRLVECNKSLFSLNNDPQLLYRSGQLALVLGDKGAAEEFFTRAAKAFSPRSEYSRFALRLSERLHAELRRQRDVS